MAARAYSGKKPKNLKHTLRVFLSYLGRHKKMLAVVAVLVTISAGANLLGTYMIRPVVNGLADGDVHTLLCGVLITALIFGCGALAAYGYTQTMVKAAQQVVFDIRRDLFEHVQTLPLQFFDSRRHGDIMSLFTNDIDTMADALNNSFAMVIQSFIQIVGTLTLLYILNWRLSLIVTVCYGIMFWYIKFSGKRSKGYYTKQQNSLGELNGYIEELITGQKVVKVFHHEEESFTEFCKKNEELRKAGTGAQGYAATMVPVVVSISYVNYAIVAVLGGLLALHGKADIGSLASYLVFVRQAALPINQFTQQSNFLLSALAGAERVFDVMSLEPEIDEGKVELVNVKEENGALAVCEETTGRWAWKRPDGTMTELKGDVRFENVDFGYTADRLILKNISLYAKPGQKIAFVGSTGAGNDQIRFDMTFLVLAPNVEIITLTRDMALSRDYEINYLKEHGFEADFTKLKYSYNVGLWGTSICGGEILDSTQGLPESAYLKQVTKTGSEELRLEFKNGEIHAVNGKVFEDKIAAIQKVEEIGAAYGIGRDMHVGDTIIGIKGRVGFEAAAPMLIIGAHRFLEKYTLSKWQQYWKDQVANWYGMFLHESQYLEPVMRDIEAMLESSQRNVNGTAILELHPLCFSTVGVESDDDLVKNKFGEYGEMQKGWTAEDAKGFIKVTSTALRAYYSNHKEEKENI